MQTNQRAQIDAEMATILRPVDAYIDYIANLPKNTAVKFGDEEARCDDRRDITFKIYLGITLFSRSIIRFAGKINSYDICIITILDKKYSFVFNDEDTCKKIWLDPAFLEPWNPQFDWIFKIASGFRRLNIQKSKGSIRIFWVLLSI